MPADFCRWLDWLGRTAVQMSQHEIGAAPQFMDLLDRGILTDDLKDGWMLGNDGLQRAKEKVEA